MGLFIFGTIWFWLLSVAMVFLIIFFLEDALSSNSDTGGGIKVTLTLLGFFGLYYFFGSSEHITNIFEYVKTHTGTIIILIGAYFIAGAVWATVKWFFFLLKKRDELRNSTQGGYFEIDNYIPKAKYNKSRIMTWMMYWPFSSLWTLINDPVKKTFQIIYRNIESYFDKMSQRIFAEDKKTFLEKKKNNK